MIRELVGQDHLPDYRVAVEDDMVIFRNRSAAARVDVRYPALDAEAYHDARLVAPGYDVHYLEHEWRNWWIDSGRPELGDARKAFVGFCRARHKRSPNP